MKEYIIGEQRSVPKNSISLPMFSVRVRYSCMQAAYSAKALQGEFNSYLLMYTLKLVFLIAEYLPLFPFNGLIGF
jgi:hypothetical protein